MRDGPNFPKSRIRSSSLSADCWIPIENAALHFYECPSAVLRNYAQFPAVDGRPAGGLETNAVQQWFATSVNAIHLPRYPYCRAASQPSPMPLRTPEHSVRPFDTH